MKNGFLRLLLICVYVTLSTVGWAQCLTTTDTNLNTGAGASTATITIPFSMNASSVVCNPPFLNFAGNFCFLNGGLSAQYWQINTDWFVGGGVGSGSESVKYGNNGTQNGTVTMTVSASGISLAPGVNGYPFIQYGTAFGLNVNGQPPQFPFLVNSNTQFNVDQTYSLTGTITGGNNDMLLDEWIGNSTTGTAVEVAIFPYYDFAAGPGSSGTFVQNFSRPVTVNGITSSYAFLEYEGYPGGGFGTYPGSIFFIWPGAVAGSPVGTSSGEVALDVMPFLVEAMSRLRLHYGAAAINAIGPWSSTGHELGAEWGDTTSPNFTLTITKMQVQTCPPVAPPAPVPPILGAPVIVLR